MLDEQPPHSALVTKVLWIAAIGGPLLVGAIIAAAIAFVLYVLSRPIAGI
jgi:hypothetical protein